LSINYIIIITAFITNYCKPRAKDSQGMRIRSQGEGKNSGEESIYKAKGIAMVLYFVKLDMLDNRNIPI
jgi:hypothetical protein